MLRKPPYPRRALAAASRLLHPSPTQLALEAAGAGVTPWGPSCSLLPSFFLPLPQEL